MNAKKITLLSLFCAVAMIMSYIEAIIPLPLPFGIKVGLPNIIIVFILYRFGAADAVAVSIIRVLLVALLFGNALSEVGIADSNAAEFFGKVSLLSDVVFSKSFSVISVRK